MPKVDISDIKEKGNTVVRKVLSTIQIQKSFVRQFVRLNSVQNPSSVANLW